MSFKVIIALTVFIGGIFFFTISFLSRKKEDKKIYNDAICAKECKDECPYDIQSCRFYEPESGELIVTKKDKDGTV